MLLPQVNNRIEKNYLSVQTVVDFWTANKTVLPTLIPTGHCFTGMYIVGQKVDYSKVYNSCI